jgi:hypothetical protein
MFIDPCLPTISRTVPTGPQWAFEIEHDGFRFLAVRQLGPCRQRTSAAADKARLIAASEEDSGS